MNDFHQKILLYPLVYFIMFQNNPIPSSSQFYLHLTNLSCIQIPFFPFTIIFALIKTQPNTPSLPLSHNSRTLIGFSSKFCSNSFEKPHELRHWQIIKKKKLLKEHQIYFFSNHRIRNWLLINSHFNSQ